MRTITMEEENRVIQQLRLSMLDLRFKDWMFQRVDLVLGWEIPYIILYSTEEPYEVHMGNNHVRTLRLSLASPEIIELTENYFINWFISYDEMKYVVEFLTKNLRQYLFSAPPISVWDYLNYYYHEKTGNPYLTIPDYQSIKLKIIDEGYEDDNADDFDYSNIYSSELNEYGYTEGNTFVLSEDNRMYIRNALNLYNNKNYTHFIISDAFTVFGSSKAARISLLEPKYLHCSDVVMKEWVLSKEEISTMMDYFSKDNYRMWRYLLEDRDELYMREAYDLTPLLNIPMPDYTKLL